ncbi:MAG: hypothetical protein ACRCTL_18175 [Pseudomonas sp.]
MNEVLFYILLFSTPIFTGSALFSAGLLIYKKNNSLSALCAAIATAIYLALTLFANLAPTEIAYTAEGEVSLPGNIASLASDLSGMALIVASMSFLVYALRLKKA